MKKIIELPDEIYNVLEEHKKITGRPITSMVQEAVYRWLVHEKLIKIRTVIIEQTRKENRKIEKVPEEVRFCDGDKCNI